MILFLIKQLVAQPIINIDPSQSANLNAIINSVAPGSWIVFADGTYTIPEYIAINVNNITLTSSSGNPASVIINGDGMNGDDYGFLVYGNNITISHMTIQNVRYNCIDLNENIDGFHINNCVLRNAGEFFVDVSWTSASSPSENGIVENCIFEYPTGSGVNTYLGGIKSEFCKDWIIRNNVFRSIRSPSIGSAAYAVLFWRGSEANIVEKNHIINCDRGIGFGISTYGNSGGIIRNNFIWHENILENDQVGITLETSPYTQIYNNTIYIDQNVMSSIEYRYNASTEIFIANNLTNKPILARDGATATDTNNVTVSSSSWFVDITSGDLHLSSDTLSEIIDMGIAVTGLTEDF
ncbi:MAG: right-handed parallel beta-helix repeat-containing protein, partial [bacterium]